MKNYLPVISSVSLQIPSDATKLPKNHVFERFSLHLATEGIGAFRYQLPNAAHTSAECAGVFVAFLPPGTKVSVQGSGRGEVIRYSIFEFDSPSFQFDPDRLKIETTFPSSGSQSIALHRQFAFGDRSLIELFGFSVAGIFGWGAKPSEKTAEYAGWALPAVILKLFELDRTDHIFNVSPLLVMEGRLRNDIRLECTMDQIVEGLGAPRRALIARFKRKYGVSPFAFRHYERVKKIVAEITDTDKNFSEIAVIYGFSNVSCLTTMVKKATGVTPSEMRQTSRNVRWRKLFTMPRGRDMSF